MGSLAPRKIVGDHGGTLVGGRLRLFFVIFLRGHGGGYGVVLILNLTALQQFLTQPFGVGVELFGIGAPVVAERPLVDGQVADVGGGYVLLGRDVASQFFL